MKKIKNGIKKFYLFTADNSIDSSLLIIFILFVLFYILLIIINGIDKADIIMKGNIVYFIMAFIFFALINKAVIAAKVTYLKDESYLEITLLHLPSGAIQIYEKPFWGQPPMTIVQLPNLWNSWVENGDTAKVKTTISVKVNANMVALIPIIIEFTFSGPFQAEDLQKVLQIKTPICLNTQTIRLEDYILDIFQSSNNSGHKNLREDTTFWAEGKMSLEEFAEKISQQIKFPEKFLTNVEKTTISIGAPKLRIKEVKLKK